jgi:hypothetical protein
LGKGTFGEVMIGTHTFTGEKVAIKVLEKDKIVDVHDVERVAGGSHSQKKNGSNEENGEAETKGVKGPVVKASESSDKKYSKGGDGHQHHKGDMVTSVEEGGKHFNVAKDFTVTATGKLIKLNSSKEIAFKSGGNETHEVAGNTSFVTSNKTKIISQSDINIISTQSITLRVGDTSIIVSDGKILLTVGDSKGIQIDASGVSLSKGTLWVGDSKPGAHDATPVSPPFKIP